MPSVIPHQSGEEEAFTGITVRDRLLTGRSGSFQTPNYPGAPHRLDCIWLIALEDPSNVIRLVFVDFDTEPDFDFVFVRILGYQRFEDPFKKDWFIVSQKVHDGDTTEHPILMASSGSKKPSVIRSTGNKMLIRFVTNGKVTSRGFQANYYSVPPCITSVQSSSGVILSPYYPLEYDNNLRCDWLISVGPSEKILLELMDVYTEEDQDVIQIYDGDSDRAPFLRRISGDHRQESLVQTTTTNSALIRFTTDNSVTGTGFTIKFTAGSDSGDYLVKLKNEGLIDLFLVFETELALYIFARYPGLPIDGTSITGPTAKSAGGPSTVLTSSSRYEEAPSVVNVTAADS